MTQVRVLSSSYLGLLLLVSCLLSPAKLYAQLDLLSSGDIDSPWRDAQLEILREQLKSQTPGQELEFELEAQVKWLSIWKPSSLTAKPAWPTPQAESRRLTEPTIDPDRRARRLRLRLLGKSARPTSNDTRQLELMLAKFPNDVGVRQLHLHWLDQLQYRKQYCDEIASAAERLAIILQELAHSKKNATLSEKEIELATAFCLYRRGRALAYRELPDVVAKRPIEDPQAHEAMLLETFEQLSEMVGRGRPEFILLEIRMLRRDRWFGRALSLLEQHAHVIDTRWYLKKRRDLLMELGWDAPAKEAAAIYAEEFPEAVAEEKKAG